MKKYNFIRYMAIIFVLLGIVFINCIIVHASIKDEAQDYTLGDTVRMKSEYVGQDYYFKFSLNQMSHVSLEAKSIPEEGYYAGKPDFYIYNSSGKAVFYNQNVIWKTNKVEGYFYATGYRTLPKGEYYLRVNDGNRIEYSFRLQAENKIFLRRGEISLLKSNRAGQMTITCKTVNNAIGYRIQYSTDYRFKKNVKTIYSESKTKTVTNLKKGVKYYVKIQPFNVYDDGEYEFGVNSLVKGVTIKK